MKIPLIQIPAGSFLMGSPEDEPKRHSDEGPQHLVTLQGFLLGQTPITQAQWREVASWQPRKAERWGRELNPSPSRFGGHPDSDQRPVEQVSWHDAMEFCHRLSQRTGRHYTLPSEAQWEYACRAGFTTPFAFGATLSAELANYAALASALGRLQQGHTRVLLAPTMHGSLHNTVLESNCRRLAAMGEYREQTTPVGMFPANAWGLHDMHGNVWEWCLDYWHPSYAGAPSDGSAWLKPSASKEEQRLVRGGSWLYGPGYCRSACRNHVRPGLADGDVGFRVVADYTKRAR